MCASRPVDFSTFKPEQESMATATSDIQLSDEYNHTSAGITSWSINHAQGGF